MTGDWRDPLPVPMFAWAIAEELIERDRAEGEKEQAFKTPFRFSGALDCARKLGLRYAGFEQTDPIDGPGLIVAMRGTLMHEITQDAILKRFPGAQFEIKGNINDLVSGHIDALIDHDGKRYAWELKNKPGYKWDKAVGFKRLGRPKRFTEAEGPALGDVIQAGFNALAHGASEVVVAYISLEAISKQTAKTLHVNEPSRIVAEWVIPRDVWEPLARAEVERLQKIRHMVDEGWLPVGEAVDERGQKEWLSPLDKYPKWRCWYCSHKSLCETLPATNVTIDQIRRSSVSV